MKQENDFKSMVKKRIASLDITQNVIAERLGKSYSYVSDILVTRRDTPRVALYKEKIIAILDEIERERESVGK